MQTETKATHTPGPWTNRHANQFGSLDIDAGAHKMARVYVRMSVDGCSCTGADVDEAEANARLIAAAPDMLAALEYIVGWPPEGWSPEVARDMAKAAIAKATGNT